ncbi:MAG: phosphatase PAP2 family protein, partial [Adlercreutzia equolifaciens]
PRPSQNLPETLASPDVNDLAILDAIQLIHTPWLDTLVAAYTSTSDVGQIWILLGIVLAIIPKTRKLGAAVLIAVLLGAIITSGILKPLIMRPRPCDVNPLMPMIVDRPHGSSFPSGHATAAFAAFGRCCSRRGPSPSSSSSASARCSWRSRDCTAVHYPLTCWRAPSRPARGIRRRQNRRGGKPQAAGTAIAITYLGASARIEHASRHPEAEGSIPLAPSRSRGR